jgi:DNA recombination protein RmuC
MTQKDVEQILTSTEKVTKRSRKIEALEFGDEAEATAVAGRESSQRVADSASGRLRLRVVDED